MQLHCTHLMTQFFHVLISFRIIIYYFQERRKDLTDHRDDSTFSFDPTNIPVKALEKCSKKKIDSRKGVLLSSYTRKKTRRRKRRGGVSGAGGEASTGSRSVTPSPRHSFAEPVASPPPPPPLPPPLPPNPDTLHPGQCLRQSIIFHFKIGNHNQIETYIYM